MVHLEEPLEVPVNHQQKIPAEPEETLELLREFAMAFLWEIPVKLLEKYPPK